MGPMRRSLSAHRQLYSGIGSAAAGGGPTGQLMEWVVASPSSPGVLYDPFGAFVDGATQVQSSVPLVRRLVDGRRVLGHGSTNLTRSPGVRSRDGRLTRRYALR